MLNVGKYIFGRKDGSPDLRAILSVSHSLHGEGHEIGDSLAGKGRYSGFRFFAGLIAAVVASMIAWLATIYIYIQIISY